MFAAFFSRLRLALPATGLIAALAWVFVAQPFAQAEMSVSQAQAQVAATRNLLSQATSADQRADTLLASARTTLERATSARESAYRNATAASERDTAASTKASELEKAYTSARTWFANATKAHNDAATAHEDARLSRDIAKSAVINAEANLAGLDKQVDTLSAEKEQATAQVRSWTQKVDEARKSGASKQKIRARTEKLKYWRKQRDTATSALTQAKSARDSAADTVKNLTQTLTDAEAALDKATKAQTTARNQLDKAQGNLNARSTALTTARAAVRDAASAHARALATYRGSDTAYDRAYQAVVSAVARKNDTQDDRAQAQADFEEAAATLERLRNATTNAGTGSGSGSTQPDRTPQTPDASPAPTENDDSVSTDQWLEQFTDIDISPEAKNDTTEPIVVPDLTVVGPGTSEEPAEPATEPVDPSTEPAQTPAVEPALPGGSASNDPAEEITPTPVDTVEFASSEAPDSPTGPSPLIIVIGVLVAVAVAVAWQFRPALLAGSTSRSAARPIKAASPKRSRKLRNHDNAAEGLHVVDDDPYALQGSAPASYAAMQTDLADSFTGQGNDSLSDSGIAGSVFTPQSWGAGSVLDQDFTETLATPPSFSAETPTAPESTVTVLVRDSDNNVLLFHNGFAWGPLNCPASTGSDPIVDAANLLRSVTGWAVGMGADLDARIVAVDGFSSVVEIHLPPGEHTTESGMWGTVEQVSEACPDQPWLAHLS